MSDSFSVGREMDGDDRAREGGCWRSDGKGGWLAAGWGLTGAMDGSPVDHACVRCEMQTKP